MEQSFSKVFESLTGHRPFPWQQALFDEWFAKGKSPQSCNLPTGLGKTNVIVIWLIALLKHPDKMPRRLVYVVNRRTVVDQTTDEVMKLREKLKNTGFGEQLGRMCAIPLKPDDSPLAISTLRGQFADNREWSADPARPAVICGTVDMIGSRLLFNGYGVGFRAKPLHAGFLGQDVLLVHDEAHLEPAFQRLIAHIEKEQRNRERTNDLTWPKLCVMELTATSREEGELFKLGDNDHSDPVVEKRIKAMKALHPHEIADEKMLSDRIAELALDYKDSGCAILVFVRKVEDVDRVIKKLPKGSWEQLTGTLRGLERDGLVKKGVFQRFLPASSRDPDVALAEGTVYLVCTSAGEVGVNISADHLVCDLSTFESMAQRFGRVNRFGDRDDTAIHLVYPRKFNDKDPTDPRRRSTLDLLNRLSGDASPLALEKLPASEKLAAFAPTPEILPTTDVLFDAWALTTIRDKLPGRPSVEPYLHGKSEWQLPETQVAWREEVEVITGDLLERYNPIDLLDVYPLKPHELLRDRSDRVFKHLTDIANRHSKQPVWLLDDQGVVEPLTLEELTNKNRKDHINYRTVLLPPEVGGLQNGTLDGKSTSATDVADRWFADKAQTMQHRVRVWDDDSEFDEKTRKMRLVRRIDFPGSDENEDAQGPSWHWFTRPRSADDDLSKTTVEPIGWKHHTDDVTQNVTRIVATLELPSDLQRVLIVAAALHDLGKKRVIWQRSIGNPDPSDWHAKSGKAWKSRDICPDYRHEFGSLLDVLYGCNGSPPPQEFVDLSEEQKELVLHLIAAHHGYARPHFPAENADDSEHEYQAAAGLAIDVPRRFARLQRKYGRWGLAYIESLLRAADWAASANPSEVKQ